MGWRTGTAEGWVDVPVAIGDDVDAEQFNECVEAINERCTWYNNHQGYAAEDPGYVATLSFADGIIQQDGASVNAWADADYPLASLLNAMRSKVEDLIPLFQDPDDFNESTGHWAALTVNGLLPNGWEKEPDETDQYYSEGGQARGYDPGDAGTTYGDVVGVVGNSYASADHMWTEHLNQIRSVVNQLIWKEVAGAEGVDRDGSYVSLTRQATGSGASRTAAIDDWWVNVSAATPAGTPPATGYTDGYHLLYLHDGAGGYYVTPETNCRLQQKWWRFLWPANYEVKSVKLAPWIESFYESGVGKTKTAWDSYTTPVYWGSTVPDAWWVVDHESDYWDWGEELSSPDAITEKLELAYRDLGVVARSEGNMSRVDMGAEEIAGRYWMYLNFHNRETIPSELDADVWGTASDTHEAVARLINPNALFRIAFEYDEDTP